MTTTVTPPVTTAEKAYIAHLCRPFYTDAEINFVLDNLASSSDVRKTARKLIEAGASARYSEAPTDWPGIITPRGAVRVAPNGPGRLTWMASKAGELIRAGSVRYHVDSSQADRDDAGRRARIAGQCALGYNRAWITGEAPR